VKNTVILTVIIFIGLVSLISPQQKFRKMIYLNQSIGGHIYYEGVNTNVPAEVDSYNVKYGLTGEDAVQIIKYPDDDYPPGGNQMWKWQKAFYDSAGYSFKEDYLDPETYPVIMVKFCAASQSGIWFYWYQGPQDTINFPQTQSYYNYQWYIRKIVRKMNEYPEKFFILWNLPSATEKEGTADDMLRLAQFNRWMTDTLAMGLDAQIGNFPDNIYVFDFFNLLKSPYSNFMDSSYRDAPDDYHPNAAASEVVAPELVEKSFNAAINYESQFPVTVNHNTLLKYTLEQNYPNPFNPATTIRYTLPPAGNVKLIIYNLLGEEVRKLVNEYKESGIYTINFNASDLKSGVYIYEIEVNGFIQNCKMTLVK